jgi:hypothetical protein
MNFIIYPLKRKTSEGLRIIDFLPDRLLFPTFIFANNRREQDNFTSSSIIDKLEGTISFDILRDAMIKNMEIKETRINTPNVKTADLIKQQNEELERLERMEMRKKQEEKENKKEMELYKLKINQEVNFIKIGRRK